MANQTDFLSAILDFCLQMAKCLMASVYTDTFSSEEFMICKCKLISERAQEFLVLGVPMF
jgi:hypothetical protein